MSHDEDENAVVDSQEALRLLDEARGRIRTAIWALHGMHQDLSALTVDDIADVEQLLTEVLENALGPGIDAISQMLGTSEGGAVTTH